MRIDIHHHHHDELIHARLAKICEGVNVLIAQGKLIMATQAEFKQILADINTATDTIAAEITKLREQITAGMTPAEEDEIKASLGGVVARLKSIGTPETPAGETPPTEPTPPVES